MALSFDLFFASFEALHISNKTLPPAKQSTQVTPEQSVVVDKRLKEILTRCDDNYEKLAETGSLLGAFLSCLIATPEHTEEAIVQLLKNFSKRSYDTHYALRLTCFDSKKLHKVVDKFPALRIVQLVECQELSKADLFSLSRLETVQRIDVEKVDAFTDQALATLLIWKRNLLSFSCSSCKNLSFIDIQVKSCMLSELSISDCPLKKESLTTISRCFPQMQRFNLSFCPTLKEDDFSALKLPKNVRMLELNTLLITNNEVVRILEEHNLILRLTSLVLSNLLIRKNVCEIIASRSRVLEHLDLSDCEELTQCCFRKFPQTLTHFNASNTQIDCKGARALLASCPKISKIVLRNCVHFDSDLVCRKVNAEELRGIVASGCYREAPEKSPMTTCDEETLQFTLDLDS